MVTCKHLSCIITFCGMHICSQQKLGYKQFIHFPPILQIEHNSKIGILEIKESKNKNKTKDSWREDGGRVRRGDHLPSHRYSRNTSTCGTTPTEHPLNAGRKRQTSQKARNSTHTWVGQKKK